MTATKCFAVIRKVTLFVNDGLTPIIHSIAIDIFKNTMVALKAEKGFDLVISEQTNTAEQKALALSNLKSICIGHGRSICITAVDTSAKDKATLS